MVSAMLRETIDGLADARDIKATRFRAVRVPYEYAGLTSHAPYQ